MASDATKAGSLYLEIRAEIKKLSKDLAAAEAATKQSVDKMHKTIEKGIDFGMVAAGATAATAAIYAAFRAVGQAIESARVGAVLEKQATAFNNLSIAAGTSSTKMIASLKASSQGLVAESDLMTAAGKAMLMSIPADKISELMKIAAATSKMTGQSITEAFNDITMGVARQSRMILDNLGIIVNVDDANKKYARTLGTTAEALDDVQKRQAFMNAVLEAGADMIKRLGSAQTSLDGAARLTAEWTDMLAALNKKIAEESNPLFEAMASVLKRINLEFQASAEAAKMYGESIETIDARIAEMEKRHGSMSGRKESGYNEPVDQEYRKLLARREQLRVSGTNDLGRGRVGRYGATFEPKTFAPNRMLDTVEPDYALQFKDYLRDLESAADKAKKAADEIKKLNEEISKLQGDFADAKMFSGESSNYEKMEAQLRAGAELSNMEFERIKTMDKMAEDAFKEEQRRTEERIKMAAEANEAIMAEEKRKQQIFEDTMNIMSQNFSDAFAGFVMGTKSASDAFNSMTQSIISAMVRMASQKAFEQIFGLIASGISNIGSGSTGMGTNTQFDYGQILGDFFTTVRHGGGVVGSSGGPMRSIPSSYFATAPRLHGGLMADEYPAVLQKGEQVIPKGKSASSGGDIYNVYNISAIDSQSFVDAARRSGAVPLLAAENINQNGGLRRAIVTRAR